MVLHIILLEKKSNQFFCVTNHVLNEKLFRYRCNNIIININFVFKTFNLKTTQQKILSNLIHLKSHSLKNKIQSS